MINMKGTIKESVNTYIQLGLKPVPLGLNTKKPVIEGYLTKTTDELWLNYNFNVGLQCGIGGLICFDADDEITASYLDLALAPYNPWTVQTRDGKHYWLRSDEHKWNKSFKVMSGKYAGEVRLQNCQTVVPPSYVKAEEYKDKTKGSWQYKTIDNDVTTMGYIPVQMVELFIDGLCNTNKIPEKTTKPPLSTTEQIIQEQPEIRINHLAIKMPHIEWTKVENMIEKVNWLRDAKAGESLTINNGKLNRKYRTRSEVFQSIVYSLVRYGYTDDQIVKICKNEGILYHKEPYYQIGIALDRAYSKLVSDPIRIELQELYCAENQYQHVNDKLVYRFLLTRAMQFNRFDVTLNKADLMVFTGIKNYQSINNSIYRLEKQGLVSNTGTQVSIKGRSHLKASTEDCVYLPSTLTYPQIGDDNELHIDLIAEKIMGNSVKTFIAFFGEDFGLQTGDIAKLTELPKRTVRRHIAKLLNLELIESTADYIYKLHPDWRIILYDLANTVYETNKAKIEEKLAEWYIMLENQKIYGKLKDVMSQSAALAMIKEYELNGVVTDEIMLIKGMYQ